MSQNNLAPTDSTQTYYHCVNKTIPLNFLSIYLPSPKKVIKSCEDFGQVNSGWLILYVFSWKGGWIRNERRVFSIYD